MTPSNPGRFTGWRTPQLLEAARTSSDFSFDAMGQVDLDQWWKGRIALIGDAAACPSPLSGLGTSVALVGAYVLAGELGSGTGHAAALSLCAISLTLPRVSTRCKRS